MKTIIYVFGATLAFAMFLQSCETVVEVDLPERDSKLVLNSLFSQDSVFVFTVSASKGILEPGALEYFTHAQIEITGTDGSHEVISGSGSGTQTGVPYAYVSTIKPKANVAYSIKATVAGYPAAGATDALPPMVPVDDVDTATTYDFGYKQREVSISFTDPADEVNFYEVKLFYLVQAVTDSGTIEYTGEIPAYISTEGIFDGGANQQVFTDELFEGQGFTVKLAFDESSISGGVPIDDTLAFPFPIFLIAELRSASENYYKFYSSYLNYQTSSGDPFAQPVQVYNNVIGGFGIFAGYSLSRDSLRIN